MTSGVVTVKAVDMRDEMRLEAISCAMQVRASSLFCEIFAGEFLFGDRDTLWCAGFGGA